MPRQYTQEEYQKLWEKLPDEIKEVAFSPEVSDQIDQITERQGLDLLVAGRVSHYVGDVLFGLLPPAELALTLQKEAGMKKAAAEQIAHEVNRFIFHPIRPHLEQLYSHNKPQAPRSETTPETPIERAKQALQPSPEQKSPGQDTYREAIEE